LGEKRGGGQYTCEKSEKEIFHTNRGFTVFLLKLRFILYEKT